MNVEIRPRLEYTSNYIITPNESMDPYFYITQRNRTSMQYAREKWLIKSDLQEIHLWDQNSNASKMGSVNFYQLFFETKFKSINMRLGRQSVLLDNGRLFSDAPWAQQGRAHEGIRIMKSSKKISNDLFFLLVSVLGLKPCNLLQYFSNAKKSLSLAYEYRFKKRLAHSKPTNMPCCLGYKI